jgi:ribonuclease-3
VGTTQDARPSRRSRATSGLEALGIPAELGAVHEAALTHRSFAFEQAEPVEHNERLEFLGDAILGAVVTDIIYTRYPALSEGEMARLRASVVNTAALADVARSLGIGQHLRLGRGEELSGGRNKSSLLADAFEALVGAVYLDGGIAEARRVLEPIFAELISGASAAAERYDVKTALQEMVVRERAVFPSYRIASTGPDHEKQFTAHVYVGDELLGEGRGSSKKEAEQNAARQALGHLRGVKADEQGTDARAS